MKQIESLRKPLILALILALTCFLIMQFFYQSHQYDGSAHQQKHICKVCVKLSSQENTHVALSNTFIESITVKFIYHFTNNSLNELITHRFILLRGPTQIFTDNL